jgi:hypothetical protein
VAVLVAGCGGGPVALDAEPPGEEHRAACRAFVEGLPDSLADLPRREVEPADGWGSAYGDPPIVVSCGSRAPSGFTRTSPCTTVNGVDWFIPEQLLDSDEPVDLTLTTVNREPFVRVELPEEHLPPAATLVDLSAAVEEHLDRTGRCR